MDFFLSQIHEFGAPNSRTTVVYFLQIHQIHEFVQIHVCMTGPLYFSVHSNPDEREI